MINIPKYQPKNFSELRKLDREMQSDQAQTKHHLTGDLAMPTNFRSKSTGSARTVGPPFTMTVIIRKACWDAQKWFAENDGQ
jgi:hypothetical protein